MNAFCLPGRSDYYFTAVTWLSNQSFSVVWMNRRQNLSCISVCRWSSWNCDDVSSGRLEKLTLFRFISLTLARLLALLQVYEDRSEFWVDLYQPPVFSADGSQLVARLPVNDGDQGSFRQVVQVAVAGGPGGSAAGTLAVRPLTHGPMHVSRVLAWDQHSHVV